MARVSRGFVGALALTLVTGMLGGCLEKPRDGGERPLIPAKAGGYQGMEDQALTDAQRRTLRERTGLQN